MSLGDFVTAFQPIGLCSSFDQIEDAIRHDNETLSSWLQARGGEVASKRRSEALKHESAAFQIAYALVDYLPADTLATVRGALRSTTASHIATALAGIVGDAA